MEKKDNMGKSNGKLALDVYGRTVLCMVMSLFIYVSVTAVFSGVFTRPIGEQIYKMDENGEYLRDENGDPIYEVVYYSDTSGTSDAAGTAGTSVTSATAAASGAAGTTASSTEKTTRVTIRSELSAGAEFGMNLLVQVLTLMMLVAMVYSVLWGQGDRDANAVAFHHREEDKNRGLKVGLLAMIPAAVLYLVYVGLCLALPDKAGDYLSLYGWLNAPFLPVIKAIETVKSTAGRLILPLLPSLSVPLIGFLAYRLGYRQISLSEKFLYVNPNRKRKSH